MPSWAHAPSEMQAGGRTLLQSVAHHQQQQEFPHNSPQRPFSPVGEACTLSRRRLDILEAQNERLQQQVQHLRCEQEVWAPHCRSTCTLS